MQLIHALKEEQISECRRLFLDYASSLNFNLCFQNFEKELAGLPGEYAPPNGRLFLAETGSQTAGCIALRKIDQDTCEMKRLYVSSDFRGKKIGRFLVESAISAAREMGYSKIRLDTVNTMKEAVCLYRSFGFYDIDPYTYNPLKGVIYMELEIRK